MSSSRRVPVALPLLCSCLPYPIASLAKKGGDRMKRKQHTLRVEQIVPCGTFWLWEETHNRASGDSRERPPDFREMILAFRLCRSCFADGRPLDRSEDY